MARLLPNLRNFQLPLKGRSVTARNSIGGALCRKTVFASSLGLEQGTMLSWPREDYIILIFTLSFSASALILKENQKVSRPSISDKDERGSRS